MHVPHLLKCNRKQDRTILSDSSSNEKTQVPAGTRRDVMLAAESASIIKESIRVYKQSVSGALWVTDQSLHGIFKISKNSCL